MNKVNESHSKNLTEVILYLFFGVVTTLINIGTYYLASHVMIFSVLVSTIIAWVLSVIFAYITNKIYVFKSKKNKINELVKELFAFISSRVLTGALDVIFMFIFVTVFSMNDMAIKVVSNVLVVIMNYVLSKLVIFNNKKIN